MQHRAVHLGDAQYVDELINVLHRARYDDVSFEVHRVRVRDFMQPVPGFIVMAWRSEFRGVARGIVAMQCCDVMGKRLYIVDRSE